MSSRAMGVIGSCIAVVAAVGILVSIIYWYATEDERQAASDLARYNAAVLPAKAHHATLVESREISECVNEAIGAELRKYRVLSILPTEEKAPRCWDQGIYSTSRVCAYPFGAEITLESAWDGERKHQVFEIAYEDLKLGWTNSIGYTLKMESGVNVRIDPMLMEVATPTQVCRSLTRKLQCLIEQRLE